MNERIEELMYQSGLTAQGCWDEMDEYDRTAILKFSELIIQECIEISQVGSITESKLKEHFGIT